MNKASESILALKPVTFHYKSDKTDTPQFGLIAEEVAKVNPHLVVHDNNGEVYSVRYDQANGMLLNEFLNEHRRVERQEVMITKLKSKAAKQEATVADQQKQLQAVIARLKEQAAQIQKVGAQVEMEKAARQMVLNHP
jgi:cytochrome c biogenesis protein ResB